MHPRTLLRVSQLLATALLVLATSRASAAQPLSVAVSESLPVEWTVSYMDQPILVYTSHPRQFKPFVQDLRTVKGYGVLRDAPFDHLHHHALMYAIRVNGVNFWEETSGCGVQRVVRTLPPQSRATDAGLPEARLEQVIHWLAPEDAFLPDTNAPALLVERRVLRLVIDPVAQETALYWQSRFEVGSKTNRVTLTGANYHGLGMRFLQELDPLARHFTDQGNPDLANNRQDVAAYPWQAIGFDAPGKPATIAVFGGPANARGNPVFFAMKTPFAYLSATQGLDKEPLVYERGQSFELNYLVTVYPAVKPSSAIAERARRWHTESR